MSDDNVPNELEQEVTPAAPSVPDAPSPPEVHGDTLGDLVGDAVHDAVPAAAEEIEDQVEHGLEALGLPPEIASAGADLVGDVVEDGLEQVADAISDLLGSDDPLPKVNYSLTVQDGPDAHWAVRSIQFVEARFTSQRLQFDLSLQTVRLDGHGT